jgi:hypothetical protein
MSLTSYGYQNRPDTGRGRHRHMWRRVRWVIAGALVVLVATGVGVAACRDNADLPIVRTYDPPKPMPTPAGPLLSVSHWEGAFLDGWDDRNRMSLSLSQSADSWDHYELSYSVDAYNAMFRATDRTQYLDRALIYINNVVASARVSSSFPKSQYRDDYLGWVSQDRDSDAPGTEVPLYESYFWRYATTTLRVMRQTPAVYNDPKYRAQYDRLLNFAEVNVFEKWYRRGADANIYRSETHTAAHWALIALNLSLITTDPGRRAQYRTVVDNIDLHLPNSKSGLREQLIRNPADGSAYFWDDQWGVFQRPGQDVSHGNAVMAYVVEARDQGVNWTATDIPRFTALLTTVIWPRDGVYPAYVDGSGRDNGWIADGFVKLGRYSPAVQKQLEQYPVVNDQFIANMALNARILS